MVSDMNWTCCKGVGAAVGGGMDEKGFVIALAQDRTGVYLFACEIRTTSSAGGWTGVTARQHMHM